MPERAREKRNRTVGVKPDLKPTQREVRQYGMSDAVLTQLKLEQKELREKSERLRKMRLDKRSS